MVIMQTCDQNISYSAKMIAEIRPQIVYLTHKDDSYWIVYTSYDFDILVYKRNNFSNRDLRDEQGQGFMGFSFIFRGLLKNSSPSTKYNSYVTEFKNGN